MLFLLLFPTLFSIPLWLWHAVNSRLSSSIIWCLESTDAVHPDTLSTAVWSCNPDLNFSLLLAADPAVNVAVRSMSSLQSNTAASFDLFSDAKNAEVSILQESVLLFWWVCELEGVVNKESCPWQMVKSNALVLLEGKEAWSVPCLLCKMTPP